MMSRVLWWIVWCFAVPMCLLDGMGWREAVRWVREDIESMKEAERRGGGL
jgi:hypothetical protein